MLSSVVVSERVMSLGIRTGAYSQSEPTGAAKCMPGILPCQPLIWWLS